MKHDGLFSRMVAVPAAATPTTARGAVYLYNASLAVVTVEVREMPGTGAFVSRPLTPGYHPYEVDSCQNASAASTVFICFQDMV